MGWHGTWALRQRQGHCPLRHAKRCPPIRVFAAEQRHSFGGGIRSTFRCTRAPASLDPPCPANTNKGPPSDAVGPGPFPLAPTPPCDSPCKRLIRHMDLMWPTTGALVTSPAGLLGCPLMTGVNCSRVAGAKCMRQRRNLNVDVFATMPSPMSSNRPSRFPWKTEISAETRALRKTEISAETWALQKTEISAETRALRKTEISAETRALRKTEISAETWDLWKTEIYAETRDLRKTEISAETRALRKAEISAETWDLWKTEISAETRDLRKTEIWKPGICGKQRFPRKLGICGKRRFGNSGFAENGDLETRDLRKTEIWKPGICGKRRFGNPGFAENGDFRGNLGFVENGDFRGNLRFVENGDLETRDLRKTEIWKPGICGKRRFGNPGFAENGDFRGNPGFAENGDFRGNPGFAENGDLETRDLWKTEISAETRDLRKTEIWKPGLCGKRRFPRKLGICVTQSAEYFKAESYPLSWRIHCTCSLSKHQMPGPPHFTPPHLAWSKALEGARHTYDCVRCTSLLCVQSTCTLTQAPDRDAPRCEAGGSLLFLPSRPTPTQDAAQHTLQERRTRRTSKRVDARKE